MSRRRFRLTRNSRFGGRCGVMPMAKQLSRTSANGSTSVQPARIGGCISQKSSSSPCLQRATIELMLFATGSIAELRRADDTPVFFTDDVEGDQHAWTDGLAGRIIWPGTDAPAVCMFDTGVNRSHVLIEPALSPGDLYTLDEDWGVDD
jgi:hypothetical protein